MVLQRSAELTKTALKPGDEVRVDSNYRMALEMLSAPSRTNIISTACRNCRGRKSAGRSTALQAIKDAIELPLLHADFSRNFNTRPPKDFCFTARRVAARR